MTAMAFPLVLPILLLALLWWTSNAAQAAVVLPCNQGSTLIESHTEYAFVNCSQWASMKYSELPSIQCAPSVSNVTLSISYCASLPRIACDSATITVIAMHIDATSPIALPSSFTSLWMFTSSLVTVSILDSSIYLNASAASGLILGPSSFISFRDDSNVTVVLRNVTLVMITFGTQSMMSFAAQSLRSSFSVAMRDVDVTMQGRPLKSSDPAIAHPEDTTQSVVAFQSSNDAQNFHIAVAGRCRFYVDFGLNQSDPSTTPNEYSNVSYKAYVIFVEGYGQGTGSVVSNMSFVFDQSGSYTSILSASQYSMLIYISDVSTIRGPMFVSVHNLVAHHVASFHANTVKSTNGKVASVLYISPLLASGVVVTLHNISATFVVCSGAAHDIASIEQTNLKLSALMVIKTLLVNSTLDAQDVVAVSTFTNGTAESQSAVSVSLSSAIILFSLSTVVENTTVTARNAVLVASIEVCVPTYSETLLQLISVVTAIIAAPTNMSSTKIVVVGASVVVERYRVVVASTINMLLKPTFISASGTVAAFNLASASSYLLGPVVATFSSLLSSLGGPTFLKSTTVTVMNASAGLGEQPSAQDSPNNLNLGGHVFLPSFSQFLRVDVQDVVQSSAHTVACSNCSLTDCTITVRNASGVGALLYIQSQFVLRGSSVLTFLRARLESPAGGQKALVGYYSTYSAANKGIEFGGDGSSVTVQNTTATGFSELILARTAASCATFDVVAVICVRWDGGVAPPIKSLPRSGKCLDVRRVKEVGCPFLRSPSATVSLTHSLPPPRDNTSVPPPPLVGTSTSAAVAFLVSVSTVLSFASAGGPLAQSMIIMGQSQCSPAAVRDSTKSGRFLLSPFYALGDHAIVYGNAALFGALVGLQLLAVQYFRCQDRRGSAAAAAQRQKETFTGIPSLHPPPLTLNPAQNAAARSLPPEARARFPNLSILACGLALQGTSSTSLRMVFEGSVASTVTGVVGLLLVTAALVCWRWLERCRTAVGMKFKRYRHAVLRKSRVPEVALPLGRWGPEAAAATHGKLRSSVREGAEWLGSYTSVYAFTVNTVSAIPLPVEWCLGVWIPLVLVSLGCLYIVVRHRPARVPLVDVFNAGCLASSAVLQLVSGIVAQQEATRAEGAFAGATTVLVACTLLYTSCTLARGGHATIVFLWERQQRADDDPKATPQGAEAVRTGSIVSSQAGPMRSKRHKKAFDNDSLSHDDSCNQTPVLDSLFLLPDASPIDLSHVSGRRRLASPQRYRTLDINRLCLPPYDDQQVMYNLAYVVESAASQL